MANFLVQKAVTNVMDDQDVDYHVGVCHTTNKRFWEFNRGFIERIKISRAQAIDMESATLFCASYKYKLPTGGLFLISDLPLNQAGIKTKESSDQVYEKHTADHIDKGIAVMNNFKDLLTKKARGASREEDYDE